MPVAYERIVQGSGLAYHISFFLRMHHSANPLLSCHQPADTDTDLFILLLVSSQWAPLSQDKYVMVASQTCSVKSLCQVYKFFLFASLLFPKLASLVDFIRNIRKFHQCTSSYSVRDKMILIPAPNSKIKTIPGVILAIEPFFFFFSRSSSPYIILMVVSLLVIVQLLFFFKTKMLLT